MNRNIWIGIIVVIMLVAGGWWYFNQSNTPLVSDTMQQTVQQNINGGNQPVVNNQPTPTTKILSASPTSGTMPLSVSFSGFVPTDNPNAYLISFGDGTSGAISIGACVSQTCSFTAQHTFSSSGTYLVKLNQEQGDGVAIIGTATVIVR